MDAGEPAVSVAVPGGEGVTEYYAIQSVEFMETGVAISYTTTDAVRKHGALQLNHTLFVGAHPDYYQELADLRGKVEEIVRDALDDYPNAEVVELDTEEDESNDDDLGMGWAGGPKQSGVDG